MGWSQVRPPSAGSGWSQQSNPRPAWTQQQPNNRAGFSQQNGANRYAAAMLEKLAGKGYTPSQFGVKGNAAAQWRAISPILGALQAARAGNQANYHWNPGQGANAGVAGIVAQLLGQGGQSQQQLVNPSAPPQASPDTSWLTAPGGPMNFG